MRVRDTATLGMEALWGGAPVSSEPPLTPVQACAPVAAKHPVAAAASFNVIGSPEQFVEYQRPPKPATKRARKPRVVGYFRPRTVSVADVEAAAAKKREKLDRAEAAAAKKVARAEEKLARSLARTLTRAARKPKRTKLAPSPTPLACSILAVDPGENSGFALWSHGALIDFGECDVFGDEPARIIERLLKYEGPWVLVVERPFRVKHQNQTGIGTADTIWRKRGERYGFGKRVARRTVRVYPSTWRSVALGKGWGNAERDKARAEEQKLARALALDQLLPVDQLGDDAAPAVLIAAKWAAFAGEVLAKLPKVKPPKEPKVSKPRVPRTRRAA